MNDSSQGIVKSTNSYIFTEYTYSLKLFFLILIKSNYPFC